MAERIVLLGWGSLLWEGGSTIDAQHGPWRYNGPLLKLEFSRASVSRQGALTLVIDPENGVPTMVAYSVSRRSEIAEAMEDLRAREGTAARDIGYLCRSAENASYHDKEAYDAIRIWAAEHDIENVVWTDLRSNFREKASISFSVEAARAYLCALDPIGRTKAIEYIRRAPPFVRTPLRDALADHNEIM